ncbi:hypothetical protein RHMOL_Rhmol01G0181800 [Rhododendron molle]|uniref:Uncharacterized protein n=1 Tax=Rhododendron molle TaxID=49168 RepID=A0ACC0Q636_RHOML|nr:hypothetical protein RHMOL_Rhmol01G0181800 [Rhododendron molle]
MVAEGPPVVDRSSGGAEGSGAVGENPESNESPPRDSAKGKGVIIEEEQVERVIREEDIAFRPPAGAATSSRHVPVTYDDIAEHTPDEILARVLEQHPEIGEYILKAKEDREALGPRVSAVAEAGALERPEFSEETYTPPRSHLFVPLGFAGYRPPQQTDYDPELVLRDPGVHIANTWAEV